MWKAIATASGATQHHIVLPCAEGYDIRNIGSLLARQSRIRAVASHRSSCWWSAGRLGHASRRGGNDCPDRKTKPNFMNDFGP